jgi:MerR family transcriptional regulator/heat shock protein HspR
MNLAGVERVFELEAEIERMRRRMRNLERQTQRVRDELSAELERVRRSLKHELVLYQPASQALTPRKAGERSVRIPVRRPR